MKNIIKKISLIVICIVLVLSCTACGKSNELVAPKVFDPNHANKSADSGVYAENDTYQLLWDKAAKRISLYNKITGKTYSNTPEDAIAKEQADPSAVIHPKLNTTLIINYIHAKDYSTKTESAYIASLNKGTYEFEKIDNGFKITYHFDKSAISVPVCYTLLEDGIKISVDPNEIRETKEDFLHTINIAPFMVSTPNIAEDSYLFYPSGSGAIIEANNSGEVSELFAEEVYDADALVDNYFNVYTSNTEKVRMPVYGSVNGDTGMLAIITEGAETAKIEGEIGNSTIGYSSLFTTFNIRGSNKANKVLLGTQYTNHYTSTPMSICYYPLDGDDASYVGMANRYRKYLIDEKGMKDKADTASASVSFIGGTTIDTSFLGMPTTEVVATSTVKDTQKIIEELSSSLKLPITADLFGYGESGLDVGKPAGNLKIAKNIGSDKDVIALAKKCKELGVDLYFDYDLLHFTKNGQGLTITNGGAAKNAGLVFSRWNAFKLGSSGQQFYTYLVGRGELAGLAAKTYDDALSMDLSGVSYRKITSRAYSDSYANRSIAKANMGKDVSEILANAAKKNLRVLGSEANDYALINSDAAINTPVTSSKVYLFDYDVPFYQLVFKGYVTMYGSSVNMATNRDKYLLHCIEGGTGINYTLINYYENTLLTSKYQIFNSTLYSDSKAELIKNVNDNADYYKAIADAHIVDHVLITKDVRKVVYDNGVKVYVNFSYEDYMTEFGIAAAGSYVYGKEG